MSKLNSKTLTIGAAVLLVLALLFMATPLLGLTGVSGANRTGLGGRFSGLTTPQAGQNGFPFQRNGTQGQGNSTNPTTPANPTGRTFTARPAASLLRLGFLSGITGTIFYGIALLVSLLAAVGMFLTKRWGQVLGIIMGALYLILAVVSVLPLILAGFLRGSNFLSLGMSLLHVILAIAVIVLALIPAKKILAPVSPAAPVTQATPPAAGA